MTTLVMPRLGETVTEGVIVKWLKKEGEQIKKDEPVVEISTDKVETDIPAPSDSTLTKIIIGEGQKVAVGEPIAELAEEGVAVVRPMARVAPQAMPADRQEEPAPKEAKGVLSPLVRKLAKEKGIDLSQVKGTGADGRITKADILKFEPQKKVSKKLEAKPEEIKPAFAKATTGKPISIIRKTVAQNMFNSQKSTAHVTAVVEADFSNLDKIRQKYKENFKAKEGFSLTYLPFVCKATISVLQKMPEFNAEIQGDNLLYKEHINLGIAVAIDDGLIVPVIKKAENLSLVGLARAINDVATRARGSKLKPDEVHEGTFTVTNNGSFGSLIQTPIIVPGQVAILSLESITNRVVALDNETIAIRKRAYLPLTYDHRVIDGAIASTFLNEVKGLIESEDFFSPWGED